MTSKRAGYLLQVHFCAAAIADLADKDTMDKLSAQPTPLDRTSNLMKQLKFSYEDLCLDT
jgi:hypothetical protein